MGTMPDLVHFLLLLHILMGQVVHEGLVGMEISHIRTVRLIPSGGAHEVSAL